jgi:hypothetical protein
MLVSFQIQVFMGLLTSPDCGMTHLTNDAIRKGLKKAGLGDDKVDSFEFGEIIE